MTNTSTDPEIEQEAERMLHKLQSWFGDNHNSSIMLNRSKVLPILRELATLRRGAAKPFDDATLRAIEERAAKATKGPFSIIERTDAYGRQTEYFWCAKKGAWDSTLIERREDAEFYANALADIETLLAALRGA